MNSTVEGEQITQKGEFASQVPELRSKRDPGSRSFTERNFKKNL
jgi:hypothetical protein